MQSGELRHRAKILYNDSDGTHDASPDDWETLCEVWAAKKGLTGRLFYSAAAAQSENDVVLTIRYRTGIKPEMRIVLDGDTANPYKITSEPVDVADGKQWLEIHIQRVDQNGGS